MSRTEDELRQQEVERDALQRTVSGLQAALMFSSWDSRAILERALHKASGRLGTVESKLKDLQNLHANEAREAASRAAMIAERETRLTDKERETFAGFLGESYFTRADFGKLEQFYAKSWDRLSEDGKNQMSHRVWEGVRKGEYTFSELPPAVREKETARAYQVLRRNDAILGADAQIPAGDRSDFVRAYDEGRKIDAQKVLNRESFEQNMFRASGSNGSSRSAADRSRTIASTLDVEKPNEGSLVSPASSSKSGGLASLDLSSVNLEGLKLQESAAPASAATIVSAKGSTNSESRSRGGD